jgi:hypothetical protein
MKVQPIITAQYYRTSQYSSLLDADNHGAVRCIGAVAGIERTVDLLVELCRLADLIDGDAGTDVRVFIRVDGVSLGAVSLREAPTFLVEHGEMLAAMARAAAALKSTVS